MNQNHQHRVQTTHHYYNAAKKYKKPITADAGTTLKYDIKALRIRPGKLTKAFSRTRTRSQGSTGNKARLERMGRISENTSGTARKTYPLIKKATMAKKPEWTLKPEEWEQTKK